MQESDPSLIDLRWYAARTLAGHAPGAIASVPQQAREAILFGDAFGLADADGGPLLLVGPNGRRWQRQTPPAAAIGYEDGARSIGERIRGALAAGAPVPGWLCALEADAAFDLLDERGHTWLASTARPWDGRADAALLEALGASVGAAAPAGLDALATARGASVRWLLWVAGTEIEAIGIVLRPCAERVLRWLEAAGAGRTEAAERAAAAVRDGLCVRDLTGVLVVLRREGAVLGSTWTLAG
ncbi:MAG: hypothetical protein H6747_09950 [Deltaproteobacteria bacterium]|nr:hypothetical protein [Deltaproteobacteria bacterium]